jgi:NADPH-dependent ferric siderophore reductase
MSNLKSAIAAFVSERILSVARVADVQQISEHFRMIDLESDGFRDAIWRPGEKIGLIIGGQNKRVYTPISIDPSVGTMRLLVFLHGGGPGSKWAASVKSSDECRFMGPKSSLPLSLVNEPAVLFGDETSFAVARTLQTHLGTETPSRFVFEVSSIEESRIVLDILDIRETSLIEKRQDGSHIQEAALCVLKAMTELGTQELVLTGSGLSIQGIRGELDINGIDLARSKVRAYWAPDKTGLD